ncbi:NAD(P)/FAD-dependent oxidoreductase [Ornithinimicrobium avium]|uniref:FAD-dependent oxidoreductase n=1 Tax=Ornithinimicrobium avium TaxID=2283195 RepID=A0A345NJB8_9MICO|nr:FAD-dependent oxidoreductase [Ornithinimicrobium avium]AXH95126.1 FAD-dependent oxidoreductase [Ornithinimicrobium avium]
MRVVVVGAGIVGASCALAAARAGCEVVVLERGQVGSGTTSRGEGNVLVSDKAPGPELDLALVSRSTWGRWAEELGPDPLEFEPKGGVVVATAADALAPLAELVAGQAVAGVAADAADTDALLELEPHLAPDLPGGFHYPQDAQVQPVLAAAAILAEAVRLGAVLRAGAEVVGVRRRVDATLRAVLCADGAEVEADAVVNAAGTWGGQVGAALGAPVPVLPRKGLILVTQPVPALVHHKVYSADYVANVAASTEGLETSCVVESTRGGTVLIGASRERVGFDPSVDPATVAVLAAQAVRLFPVLEQVQLMRVYRGFRPYCPDHLPVIGPDPRVHGVLHACGHEGAGVGLAPATGELVAAHLTGADPMTTLGIDPAPFLPDRLLVGGGSEAAGSVVDGAGTGVLR